MLWVAVRPRMLLGARLLPWLRAWFCPLRLGPGSVLGPCLELRAGLSFPLRLHVLRALCRLRMSLRLAVHSGPDGLLRRLPVAASTSVLIGPLWLLVWWILRPVRLSLLRTGRLRMRGQCPLR